MKYTFDTPEALLEEMDSICTMKRFALKFKLLGKKETAWTKPMKEWETVGNVISVTGLDGVTSKVPVEIIEWVKIRCYPTDYGMPFRYESELLVSSAYFQQYLSDKYRELASFYENNMKEEGQNMKHSTEKEREQQEYFENLQNDVFMEQEEDENTLLFREGEEELEKENIVFRRILREAKEERWMVLTPQRYTLQGNILPGNILGQVEMRYGEENQVDVRLMLNKSYGKEVQQKIRRALKEQLLFLDYDQVRSSLEVYAYQPASLQDDLDDML